MPTYLSPGVYVEEVASGSRPIEGVGTSVAAFVGLAPTGPLNEPTLVTNWSQYVAAFGEFTDGYYLAHSVYGFFNNGGTAAYVVRVGGTGEGEPQAAAAPEAPKALTAGEPTALGAFKVSAIAAGSAHGGALTVEVQDVEGEGSADRFKLVVRDGDKVVESFDVSAKKSSRNYVVAQVKQRSKAIAIEEAVPAAQVTKPDAQNVTLAPPAPAPAAPAGTGAVEQIASGQFIGDSADRTGFGGLEALDEVNMVAVPDLMAAYQQGLIDLEQVKAVQLGLIAHCELMGDRMAVLDPPCGAQRTRHPQVAPGGRGLRLPLCRALLPVDQGLRPGLGPDPHHPAVRPHGRMCGPVTTPSVASTRPRPMKSSVGPSTWNCRSPAVSRICSTRSA